MHCRAATVRRYHRLGGIDYPWDQTPENKKAAGYKQEPSPAQQVVTATPTETLSRPTSDVNTSPPGSTSRRCDLRTYKIHLGSGNILMSPNDPYLCIVTSRSDAAPPSARVFLPFEGDNALSIILSKALLLAADTKIKDPTITRQIGLPSSPVDSARGG